MGNLHPENIMKYVRRLYGITALEWYKVQHIIGQSFEAKKKEAEKTICLSSDEDIINPSF